MFRKYLEKKKLELYSDNIRKPKGGWKNYLSIGLALLGLVFNSGCIDPSEKQVYEKLEKPEVRVAGINFKRVKQKVEKVGAQDIEKNTYEGGLTKVDTDGWLRPVDKEFASIAKIDHVNILKDEKFRKKYPSGGFLPMTITKDDNEEDTFTGTRWGKTICGLVVNKQTQKDKIGGLAYVDEDDWVHPNEVDRNPDGSYAYDFSDPEHTLLALTEGLINNDINLLKKTMSKTLEIKINEDGDIIYETKDGWTSMLIPRRNLEDGISKESGKHKVYAIKFPNSEDFRYESIPSNLAPDSVVLVYILGKEEDKETGRKMTGRSKVLFIKENDEWKYLKDADTHH